MSLPHHDRPVRDGPDDQQNPFYMNYPPPPPGIKFDNDAPYSHSRVSLQDDESTVGLIEAKDGVRVKPKMEQFNTDEVYLGATGTRPGGLSGLMRNQTVMRARDGVTRARDRWTREGKRKIGVLESLKNILLSSCKSLPQGILPSVLNEYVRFELIPRLPSRIMGDTFRQCSITRDTHSLLDDLPL